MIQNRYHIFNLNNAETKGYYPNELLELIPELKKLNRNFKIQIGKIYTVRAFFAISEPVNGKVAYQSGYLDVRLIMNDNDIYIGEVVTSLPLMFVLHKGSKIKITKYNILNKPDYGSIKNNA